MIIVSMNIHFCVYFYIHIYRAKGGYRDSARLLDELSDKNIEGPLGKNIARKSRNSSRVSGGGVGSEGMVTKGANWRGPGTKYKRSNNVFAVTSIALSLGRLGTRLL